jgi:hypothetical protein
MTIAMIKISDLILSEEVQSRVSLDESVINEYAEAMKNGDEFPPIDIYRDGDDNYVADGFHRIKGAIKAGLTEFKAKIKEGTIRDAILHSVSANSTHGLRRTNLDKRNAVEKLLVDPEWQLWSDRKIADKCAVSPSTVAKVRNDLSVQVGQIQERNFERNGKTHTMNTTNIGAKKEDSPEYFEPDDDKALPISEVLGGNIIKAPVEFKKPELPDEDDEEDDLNIEDSDDPGTIVVKPVNWKEKGNKFVEAMITASAFEKALEIDTNGGFPDNMKEIFAEAILLMQRNLPRYLEYFMTTKSIERR